MHTETKKNMSTYTWESIVPSDPSSTQVRVIEDKGSGPLIPRDLILTKDEFCGLHIPARSERTLNAIMVNELAREKREKEEAKKKADESSALRRTKIASAQDTWPGKTIVSHAVRHLCMHKNGRMCTASRMCSKGVRSPVVHVWAPTDSTPEDLRKIAVDTHNRNIDDSEKAGEAGEAGEAREARGSRGGYRSRRRSRRRGRKLRKRTRKH